MLFKKIMDYDASNQEVYDALKEKLLQKKVIPCIGAGLSAGFSYPVWIGLLYKLADELCAEGAADQAAKAKIADMVRHDPENAASEICRLTGKEKFKQKLERYFKDLQVQKIKDNLIDNSLTHIPFLFPSGTVLTTNYDTLLEYVYKFYLDKRYRSEGDAQSFVSLGQNEEVPTIFHMHGIVDKPDTMIITREDYEKNYDESAPLKAALTEMFKNNSVLFLGCGLEKDRYLDVLAETTEDGFHFAVLDLPEDRTQDKRKELEARKIKPIFYPQGQYGCLIVILGRLWQDVSGGGESSALIEGSPGFKEFSGNPKLLRDLWDSANAYRLLSFFIDIYYGTDKFKNEFADGCKMFLADGCRHREIELKVIKYLCQALEYRISKSGGAEKDALIEEKRKLLKREHVTQTLIAFGEMFGGQK